MAPYGTKLKNEDIHLDHLPARIFLELFKQNELGLQGTKKKDRRRIRSARNKTNEFGGFSHVSRDQISETRPNLITLERSKRSLDLGPRSMLLNSDYTIWYNISVSIGRFTSENSRVL